MAKCPLCNDTGKRMQANGQPGAYLGCSCTASLERADMHFDASKFVTEYPLGGDHLDDDLAWFIHQRAKALGRAEALAELHPLWLAEKERAELAESRITELEAQLEEAETLISQTSHGAAERISAMEAQLAAASPSDTDKLREAIEALEELADEAEANGNTSAWTNSMVAKVRSAMEAQAPVREGWIACSDRLPEVRDDSVLVLFDHGGIDMVHIQEYFGDITNGYSDDGEQLYTKYYKTAGITHWMSLPAAPVQQEGE